MLQTWQVALQPGCHCWVDEVCTVQGHRLRQGHLKAQVVIITSTVWTGEECSMSKLVMTIATFGKRVVYYDCQCIPGVPLICILNGENEEPRSCCQRLLNKWLRRLTRCISQSCE